MVRSLAADELAWFMASHFDFIGHSDPRGLAMRMVTSMREAEQEAKHCLIWLEHDRPVAGIHVIAPHEDDDDQNMLLSSWWFVEEASYLYRLLDYVLTHFDHEAAHLPLFNVAADSITEHRALFESLGFVLESLRNMHFSLTELPPLGLPLVLEAWTLASDEIFQDIYEQGEGFRPDETQWAYLKRYRGEFQPDLWFIAREAIDLDAVGYAFYGAKQTGFDGAYYLSAAGALAAYRESSEMLRRLLLTSMQDLASRSPFGRLEVGITEHDPKLIEILESLGFSTSERYRAFVKAPLMI